MENKFNNLILTIKKDRMSPEEKVALKNSVMLFVDTYQASQPSPYVKKSPYFSGFSFAHVGKLVTAGAFLVVLGVGGITAASAKALPGDFLYPVKINLKEKIEEKIALTPEAKLVFRQKRMETRLQEVETLMDQNLLTSSNSDIVESNIKREAIEISDNIAEVRKTNPGAAQNADLNIKETVRIHREKINANKNASKDGDQINYSSRILKSLPAGDDEARDDLRINQTTPEATPSKIIKPDIQIQKDELAPDPLSVSATEAVKD